MTTPLTDRLRTAGLGLRDRIQAWRPFQRGEPGVRRDVHSRKGMIRGLAIAGTLLAAIVLFLFFFDWNWLRGPVGRMASVRLDRTVRIVGDLDVHPWSWKPTIEAYNLRISQPRWREQGGEMFTAQRLVVRVEILEALRGRTVLRLLQVDGADVHLIRQADGKANWEFGSGKSGGGKLPAIRQLIIEKANLRIEDAQRKAVFKGVVSTRDSNTGEGAGRFQLTGDGDLNGARFSARVTGSPLLNISPDRPYRFDADVRAGATRITADGQIDRPFNLNRLGARFTVSGADMNDLYLLTGVTLPNTPPYRWSAGLVRDYGRYHLNDLSGRIGDSDIAGQATVETDRERPLLTADLRSRRLDFDDLSSLFGGRPSTGAGETASGTQKAMARRLFPDATLQVDRIRAMDARVRYRAASVEAPGLPLRQVYLNLTLDNGLLRGDPVELSLTRGDIRGNFQLDARGKTPRTDVDVRLINSRIESWVTRKVQGMPVIEGRLMARAKLTGYGNSAHKAVSSANGTITFVSPGGEVRQAFAELLGVNVSAGLIKLLSEDPQKTALRCAVADFQVRSGVARANRIVADTGVVLVEGDGTINLERETINLRFEGESKKPRLLRLFVPVTISGPLTKPDLGLETSGVIAQGGVAVVLGAVISPLAAILPFVEPGLAEDANCATLVAQTRRKGAPAPAIAEPPKTGDDNDDDDDRRERQEKRREQDRDREKRPERKRD